MSPKNEPSKGLSDDVILELAKNPQALVQQAAQINAQRALAARENAQHARREGMARMAGRRRLAVGVPWFDELDDEGQMRAIAEANLKAYGTIVPPPEARLAPLSKQCPGCDKVKPAVGGFGVRFYKGVPRTQSMCKQCRRERDTHARNPSSG